MKKRIKKKKKEVVNEKFKSRTLFSTWTVSSGVADAVVLLPHPRPHPHPLHRRSSRPHCSCRRPCRELGGHVQIESRWMDKVYCESSRACPSPLDVAAVSAGAVVAGNSAAGEAAGAGAVAAEHADVGIATAEAAVAAGAVATVAVGAAAAAIWTPEAAGRIDW